jgi:hypothetical protein
MEAHASHYRGLCLFLQQTENGWTLEVRNEVNGPSVGSRTFPATDLEKAEHIAKEYVDRLKANDGKGPPLKI